MPAEDDRKSNEEILDNWLSDGTPAEEPVTVETPEEASVEAVAAEEVITPDAEQDAEQVVKTFKGKLGEQDYEVPEDFLVPVKRGDEIEYVPIKEAQAGFMRQKDYSIKTSEVAENRRKIEQQEAAFAARQAKIEAREKWIAEQEERMREAQADPEKHAAYLEHLAMYERNPEYRKNVDNALRVTEIEAENEALRATSSRSAVEEGVKQAQEWIAQLASEERYRTVDPERVRAIFANALTNQGLPFERSVVEQIFDQEATFAQNVLERSPLRSELAELKAQLDALQKQREADAHNQDTDRALARGAIPNVRPTGSAPGTNAPSRERILPENKESALRAWSRGG